MSDAARAKAKAWVAARHAVRDHLEPWELSIAQLLDAFAAEQTARAERAEALVARLLAGYPLA